MTRQQAIDILASHREQIRALGVSRQSLLGSIIHDQAGPDSDIDLLVELAAPVGFLEFLGHSVDLSPATP